MIHDEYFAKKIHTGNDQRCSIVLIAGDEKEYWKHNKKTIQILREFQG